MNFEIFRKFAFLFQTIGIQKVWVKTFSCFDLFRFKEIIRPPQKPDNRIEHKETIEGLRLEVQGSKYFCLGSVRDIKYEQGEKMQSLPQRTCNRIVTSLDNEDWIK